MNKKIQTEHWDHSSNVKVFSTLKARFRTRTDHSAQLSNLQVIPHRLRVSTTPIKQFKKQDMFAYAIYECYFVNNRCPTNIFGRPT